MKTVARLALALTVGVALLLGLNALRAFAPTPPALAALLPDGVSAGWRGIVPGVTPLRDAPDLVRAAPMVDVTSVISGETWVQWTIPGSAARGSIRNLTPGPVERLKFYLDADVLTLGDVVAHLGAPASVWVTYMPGDLGVPDLFIFVLYFNIGGMCVTVESRTTPPEPMLLPTYPVAKLDYSKWRDDPWGGVWRGFGRYADPRSP